MKNCLSGMLLLGVFAFCPLPAPAQVKIARSGSTEVSATIEKNRATVTIHTTIVNQDCTCSCPAKAALKEMNLKEMSVIEDMAIAINGKSVFVGNSVYDHLFEPHWASLRSEKGNFVLKIVGLDAANSYFVRIYFDRDGVSRLLTYWGLVPDKPTSDTRFFDVELKDSP